MSSKDTLSMMEDAKKSFETAEAIVEAMQAGERKQIKDLVVEVASALTTDPKEVAGFVGHYVHKTTIAYVTRGKKGGLIKGSRPAKVVKIKKAKKADSITDSV